MRSVCSHTLFILCKKNFAISLHSFHHHHHSNLNHLMILFHGSVVTCYACIHCIREDTVSTNNCVWVKVRRKETEICKQCKCRYIISICLSVFLHLFFPIHAQRQRRHFLVHFTQNFLTVRCPQRCHGDYTIFFRFSVYSFPTSFRLLFTLYYG